MILFFDTETNGVPKSYKTSPTDTGNYPRCVQLGYASYSLEGELISETSKIIKPEGWKIPEDVEKIHGISTDFAECVGENGFGVFTDFISEMKNNKIMVAHNLNFDRPVVLCEFIRYSADYKGVKLSSFCTMQSTIDLLKLPGNYGFKFPKLMELYAYLFDGEMFDGAHDALNDVRATARCFFELLKRGYYRIEGAEVKVNLLHPDLIKVANPL